MSVEIRLFAMVTGWVLGFYGVTRRSRAGTMLAMVGVGVAEAAIFAPTKSVKRRPGIL